MNAGIGTKNIFFLALKRRAPPLAACICRIERPHGFAPGAHALSRWFQQEIRDKYAGSRFSTARNFRSAPCPAKAVIAGCRRYRYLANRGIARALDPAPYVTFNLATRQLVNEDIYREIRRMPLHGRILMEWVETPSTPDDLKKAVERMQVLQTEGVGIAIDDAGAGHDWMDRATRIRPNWIKIDGALFQSAAARYASPADIACRGIVDIASNMGAEVVAEWVETEEHVAYARDIGCRYLQGRRFAGVLAKSTRFVRSPNSRMDR